MLDKLQEEKLREEISQLRRPFWKQPAYITILVTVMLGSISYYSAERQRERSDIEALQQENARLEEGMRALERREAEARIAHAQRANELMGHQHELRVATLDQKTQTAEQRFISARERLEAAEEDLECVQREVARFSELNSALTRHATEQAERTRAFGDRALRRPETGHLIEDLLAAPTPYKARYLVGNVLGQAMREYDTELQRLLQNEFAASGSSCAPAQVRRFAASAEQS